MDGAFGVAREVLLALVKRLEKRRQVMEAMEAPRRKFSLLKRVVIFEVDCC